MGWMDKWKWVAINILDHTLPKLQALLDKLSKAVDPFAASFIRVEDHTLPRLEALLDKLSQAVDPIATRSLIKETEAAIFVIKYTFIIILVLSIMLLHASTMHRPRNSHLMYVRSQYGGTVETMARTYANLIKLHSERVQRNGIGIDAERTNVFLIGAGETAEAYLRYDHEFSSDVALQSLLPQGQSFVFRTIKDALHTLDVCCTSEKKLPKTLFILILISTQWGCQRHETFQMPSSLLDHCYAIVGIGLGVNGVPVHRLSKTSKGPNGELLTKNLPLGLGVRF